MHWLHIGIQQVLKKKINDKKTTSIFRYFYNSYTINANLNFE